jgi:transposase
MEVIFKICAGLDVHQKTVVACVRVLTPEGVQQHTKRFATTLAGLQALAAWLASFGVTHVAMESTGVYWKPVFNVLQGQFEVWIVNARDMKQLPGRKTDLNDAEWIAQLMQYGLLRRSFIPSVEQRDLRDLTRYRSRLIGERTAAGNRLLKIMEDSNVKLGSVVSRIQGLSARDMIEALIRGESDVEAIAQLARGRLRNKIPDLILALDGRIREHHRFMWRQLLDQLDSLNAQIAVLNERIREGTAPHEALIARLITIPGIERTVAEIILAEIGPNVTAFPTAQHLASWACLCPGSHISANKRQSGRTRKGQKWLRPALVQAAWAVSHKKDTYLAAQFQRLRPRRGERRAAVAVAHSILVAVYHILAKPEAVYIDLGGDYFLKHNAEQERKRAVRKLEALGFNVNLSPAPAATSAPS